MQTILRKNVRFLRKKNNYTIVQLANILGLSKYTISGFESGYTGFSIENLIKIHNLFNVSTDDLLFKDLAILYK